MKKKVLLISQYFLPDINAASFRVKDLYNALEKQNFDVSVVTANPQKSSVEDVVESGNIHRINLDKVNKKSFINYLRNYFGFMFKSIYYSLFRLKKSKFDYVFVTSPPLFVALGGLIVSKIKRTKLIIDIRDIWPDSAVSAGMLKDNGLLYKMAKVVERFIYKNADIITCVSKPMKDYICIQSGKDNIHVLYNGISSESLQSEIESKKTVKQPRNDKITVAYAGNIGIVQNMNILIEASRILSKEQQEKNFEFLIIGDGIERRALEKKASKLGINNIVFKGTLTKEETINTLHNVDLLFFSLIEDPVFEKTIPSKLFDYLLNNKAIITSIKGEGRSILESLNCAIFFNPNEPESLADGLIKYKESKELYDEDASYNRQYVTKNYNREEIFSRFLEQL